jgi:L-amino acid N-acyltransferase YncA
MRGAPRPEGRAPRLDLGDDRRVEIEPLRRPHWGRVTDIYRAGIDSGLATFETEVPSWPQWNVAHLPRPRLVARRDGEVIAWAALTPASGRCVYAGVAEVSIYVDPRHTGRGVGRALLQELVASSEREGIWTLEAGVFPENPASLRLHEACGFRCVGIRRRLGRLHGRWRDVVLLERRSEVVGT